MFMRQKSRVISALMVLFFLFLIALPQISAAGQLKPLTIEGKKFLPLRVLSRAFSNIYQDPDKKSPTVEENVPAFQSFYVYGKKASTSDLNPLGWYQVGTDILIANPVNPNYQIAFLERCR